MNKIKIYFHLFSLIVLVMQSNLNHAQNYRQEVSKILYELDSLYQVDSTLERTQHLESLTIGEAGSISEKYMLYKELLETANSNELFKIVTDKNLKPEIRGYGYMAYAYHVDSLNITEKIIDQNFKLNVLIGCRGYNQMTFQTFKNIARKRGLNNPYPKPFLTDPEESEVIELENKIRDEQGQPKRKVKN